MMIIDLLGNGNEWFMTDYPLTDGLIIALVSFWSIYFASHLLGLSVCVRVQDTSSTAVYSFTTLDSTRFPFEVSNIIDRIKLNLRIILLNYATTLDMIQQITQGNPTLPGTR